MRLDARQPVAVAAAPAGPHEGARCWMVLNRYRRSKSSSRSRRRAWHAHPIAVLGASHLVDADGSGQDQGVVLTGGDLDPVGVANAEPAL